MVLFKGDLLSIATSKILRDVVRAGKARFLSFHRTTEYSVLEKCAINIAHAFCLVFVSHSGYYAQQIKNNAPNLFA